MMRPERIHDLNGRDYRKDGKYVLYRMQASVRVGHNLALYRAIEVANELRLPLYVIFRLDINFPEANYRHFSFLINGLYDVASRITDMGGRFEILTGTMEESVHPLLKDAACVVTDKGYMKIQREWRDWLIRHASCKLIEVEDNLITPVEAVRHKADAPGIPPELLMVGASDPFGPDVLPGFASVDIALAGSFMHKAEWSARTIRPVLMSKLDYFAADASAELPVLNNLLPPDTELRERNEIVLTETLKTLSAVNYVPAIGELGGENEAVALLDDFTAHRLASYETDRNDPSLHATSGLSAYLHFGQISPLTIWEAVHGKVGAETFIEQFYIRRELAFNYVYFTPHYDTYGALPEWCRQTLEKHRKDKRPYLYELEQLEAASTHDPCWNAAMNQMNQTGFMENTMRMYWGKKVIEWSLTPQEAYFNLCYLNNRYFLDGRDANSYAGIGWCFGLHDRPWPERPIFGTVRYMNEAGLRRKYDMNAYINRIS